jgi:imidazoleglycerol-phosphate dehydratase
MNMRKSELQRKTSETDIFVKLNIDGTGRADIDTGCGFFDHMLTLFSKHGRFDLTVKCSGDTFVDYHHTVEDTGILLGKAVKKALGDMRGINRYGHAILPMDEALILAAIDVSGRGFLSFDAEFPAEKIGAFDTELVSEFMAAFAWNANITLHIKKLSGHNSHHIAEGCFKALARALCTAVSIDERYGDEIPSTKGVL